MFVPLEVCAELPVEVVGAKARNLGIALRSGQPVPDGGCLPTETLRHAFDAAGLKGWLTERVEKIAREPLSAERTLAEIRGRIRALEPPSAVASDFRAGVEALLALGPVAVRSSAPVEDGATAAYPGVFHSAVGLRSMDAVEDAVRECWASAFSARALIYGRGRPVTEMAVVLQRAVAADVAGVLFTRDPLGGEGMIAELSAASTDEITAGRSPSRRLRLAAYGVTGDDPHEKTLSAELLRVGIAVQDSFRTECDVEWAWADGRMYLLQVRPITTGTSDDRITEWCDQEDLERVFGIALGRCTPLLARQLQKKVWYRRFCQRRGISTYRLVYTTFTADGLEAAQGRFLENFGTSHVHINWGTSSDIVPVDQLVDVLTSEMNRNPVPIGRACAQIGEVVAATSTGYSALLSGGRVRIEAFPAGLDGMKDGTHLPSIYEVDPEGGIVSDPARFDRTAEWQPQRGNWTESHAEPYDFVLPAALVRRIADATRQLAGEFGEVRLEWYGVDELMFVKDLTLESQPIEDAETGVISPGTATGRVVRVEVEEFDRLGREFEVSVVNDEDERARLEGSSPVARIRELGSDAIVVADHASIGLIALVGSAAGFVFRRGSLLCHTAIALREHGIPAVVSPRGFADLQEGDRALIGPDGVSVLAVRSS